MGAITFGIGQDCDVEITGSDGSNWSFSTSSPGWLGSDLDSFDADPKNNLLEHVPMSNNGYARRRTERQGWKGTFTATRINGTLEKIEIAAHNLYHSGQGETTYSMHTTIQNQDGTGSVDEYEFTNCNMRMSKGAPFKSGEITMITFEFDADDCIDQSAGALSI